MYTQLVIKKYIIIEHYGEYLYSRTESKIVSTTYIIKKLYYPITIIATV